VLYGYWGSKETSGGFLVFVMFEVILLAPGPIDPQVTGATLPGTVTDQSGSISNVRGIVEIKGRYCCFYGIRVYLAQKVTSLLVRLAGGRRSRCSGG
jgi:hypothetical protein